MRDYEKQLRALREADLLSMCGECGYKGDKKGPLFSKAADAIEELQTRIDRAVGLYNKNVEKTAMYETLIGISPEPPKEETND
ncbi:MAG: hypothetical protein II747_07575 [Clostridia bacterium]|nr:hypothetical protein [Clostridia bacterium]